MLGKLFENLLSNSKIINKIINSFKNVKTDTNNIKLQITELNNKISKLENSITSFITSQSNSNKGSQRSSLSNTQRHILKTFDKHRLKQFIFNLINQGWKTSQIK